MPVALVYLTLLLFFQSDGRGFELVIVKLWHGTVTFMLLHPPYAYFSKIFSSITSSLLHIVIKTFQHKKCKMKCHYLYASAFPIQPYLIQNWWDRIITGYHWVMTWRCYLYASASPLLCLLLTYILPNWWEGNRTGNCWVMTRCCYLYAIASPPCLLLSPVGRGK